MTAAFHVRLWGRVQGVGFRFAAREEARRLALTGWVRNADDGSVEAYAEGAPERLEAFYAWLRRGPPGSAVERTDRQELKPAGTAKSFTIEY